MISSSVKDLPVSRYGDDDLSKRQDQAFGSTVGIVRCDGKLFRELVLCYRELGSDRPAAPIFCIVRC